MKLELLKHKDNIEQSFRQKLEDEKKIMMKKATANCAARGKAAAQQVQKLRKAA